MPTAILSVHDKTGLIEFARGLTDLGWTLLASGGTAKLLREHAISVTEVAAYTKSPEILGGRVKTLHPAIHGGLLARPTQEDRQQLLDLNWDYIDLVAVNLYPFDASADERLTRGFISITTTRPVLGSTPNWTFEPPVCTPTALNTRWARSRRI